MKIEDKVKGVAGKGTSFLKEFRDFAMKGNVIDMAVGVVIGTAFGKIVSSLVSDIIMPLVGVLVGITLQEKTADHDAIVLGYGAFIQTVLDFIIIAFAIFLTIKVLARVKNAVIAEKAAEPAPVDEKAELLKEIRDLLKDQQSKKD